MYGMNRLLFLLGTTGALLCGADLAGVHKVYVMPMAKGLDQYLANRISGRHVFEVVTDPKLADAVLTDAIGENFQAQLELISPTPKPPEAKAAETAKTETAEKPAKKPVPRTAAEEASSVLSMFQDTEGKTAPPVSSFGKGKGTIFLVDAKSRQVVWSTFDPTKGTRNHDLDRTASDIVSRLRKDMAAQEKVEKAEGKMESSAKPMEASPQPASPAPATPAPAATAPPKK